MVLVKDLVPKQGGVNIVLDLVEMGQVREFAKFGKPGRVCSAIGVDETGDKVQVTLWNEQIDQVKVGDKIEIKDGYVSEWQGEKQLSTGRNGTLAVTSGAAKPAAPAPEPSSPDEQDSVEEETIE